MENETASVHNAEKGKVRYFPDFRTDIQVAKLINYLLLTLLLGDEMRLASAHTAWWVRLAAPVGAELTSSVDVLSRV